MDDYANCKFEVFLNPCETTMAGFEKLISVTHNKSNANLVVSAGCQYKAARLLDLEYRIFDWNN